MGNRNLLITVSEKTKERIVSYNRYGLFRSKGEPPRSADKKVKEFNQKWNNSLEALLINSLLQERFLTSNLVKHKLIETAWTKALENVRSDRSYCEFSYGGLLCVAQLEAIDENELELQNLWGLRYSKLPPEVICVDLGTEANREKLESAALIIGEKSLEIAKEAILNRVDGIIRNLENQNQSFKARAGKLERAEKADKY
jgi:hypothetical protein